MFADNQVSDEDKQFVVAEEVRINELFGTNDVEILEVNAIANSKKARVVVEKPDKLVVGENLIKIIVTMMVQDMELEQE